MGAGGHVERRGKQRIGLGEDEAKIEAPFLVLLFLLYPFFMLHVFAFGLALNRENKESSKLIGVLYSTTYIRINYQLEKEKKVIFYFFSIKKIKAQRNK